jgi:hypothetical protein
MNPERLANALAESKTVNLDVLSYSQDELMVILYEVFQSTGLPSELGFNNQKLQTFIWAIRTQGYYNNAYHCFEHACDVFLTLHAFLCMTDSMDGQRWSRMHLASALFAAIIHDLEHPGFNNDFLIKTRAPVAITYNDRSVLENHHCAQGFRALLHPRLNFVEDLSSQDFNLFRSISIQLVLATDMSRHGEYMKLVADPMWPTGTFPTSPSQHANIDPCLCFINSAFSTLCVLSSYRNPLCHRRTKRLEAFGTCSQMLRHQQHY